LYAAVDLNDRDHARSVAALRQPGVHLVIPALVVSEASYLIARRLGSDVEARFLASLADLDVRGPEPDDWKRISQLVGKYRDLPLGGTDASIVVLADRLRTRLIITLDHRDFRVVRNAAGEAFELRPEL
jgi:predicted nucleic acid-binding protein